MLGNKKKRKVTQVDSLIGQHTIITGDLSFTGGCHVDGKVIGNISSEDVDTSVLTVSDRGSIEGEIKVPYLVLNGSVIGDVYVHQHIELAANARVEGNVYYNLLEMTMGAEVNGQLIHQLTSSGEPPLNLGHNESE
ncbi:MAG: polymer-forming cytoskeletal protein [Gammaproteobacteria bacterium]